MAKIVLEFASQRELDAFISEYIANSVKHAQGENKELDSAEQYGLEEFESATRWSEKARCRVSIQDMNTNHIFNAIAQKIVELRSNKEMVFVEDFTLAALIWHAWQRVKENIKENVLCEN